MKNRLKPAVGLALLLAATLAHADRRADELAAGRELFNNNGCANCHATTERLNGPALKEIAQRYKGKKVLDEIAARIREGSGGRWGDGELHPPQGFVEPGDAKLLANWILNGAP